MHGAIGVWQKWLKVPEHFKADAIMFCGDLTGKGVVPFVQEKGGWAHYFYGKRELLKSEKQLQEMEQQIAMTGLYPIRTTPEEVEQFKKDPALVDKIMKEKIVARMKEWMDQLVSTIDLKKIPVVVMPGNDDDFAVDAVIKSYADAGVVWALDGPIEVLGFQVMSFAHVNPTPWDTPREAPEEKLAEMLEVEMAKLDPKLPTIFNIHAPPYGTSLDQAPKLRKDLTPEVGPGGIEMVSVGSKAVREAIRKFRPKIGLHGHIHESSGHDVVDGVPVVNPGSEYGENVLRGVIVEVSGGNINRFWRVEG